MPKVTINKAVSGDLTLASIITVTNTWTYTSMLGGGAFTTTDSTVNFNCPSCTAYSVTGTHTLYNITISNSNSSNIFYITNTVTVTGTLAIKGTARAGIATGTINAQGNITITNTGTDTANGGSNGTININGAGDQTLTGSGTADQGPLPSVTVNKDTGTLYLVSIITVTGAWTWTAGSLNAGTSTIYYNPLSSYGVTPGNVTYYNINVSPSAAYNPYLLGNLTLSGTLTKGGEATTNFNTNATFSYSITAGNIIITAGGITANASTITVSGNFTNSATFTKGTSTLVFNGASSSTIDPGASSFNDFTCSTASKALVFNKDNATVISRILTLNGGACETQISLDSSDGTNQFTINATGTKSVSYVDVQNSNATTAISATHARDFGNNTNWTFTSGCNTGPTAPTVLYINMSINTAQSGVSNPVAVGDSQPVFSAIYNDPETGDVATKYEIITYSDSDCTSQVWDSGSSGTLMTNCTQGNRCSDITYAGTAIPFDGVKYYWKISYWDQVGTQSAFSDCTANFTILGPADQMRHGNFFFNLTTKKNYSW